MLWFNQFNLNIFNGAARMPVALSTMALSIFVLTGCNVGKTDTVSSATSGGGTTALSGSCMGSYTGGYNMPDQATRIANRNRSLADRGIAVTADEDENNRNAGGGPPDGGIWMSGGFQFETDGNCKIIKSNVTIFAYTGYYVDGTINKDGTFNLIWSGNGSQGEMIGKVDANRSISGKFNHPAPDTYVHGVLSGTFTPNGKI